MVPGRHFRRALDGVVHQGAEAAPATVRVAGAPHLLEVFHHEQPETGRQLVHLLNHELQPVEQVVPALDLEITLAGGPSPARVRALRAGVELTVTRRADGWSCVLPRLEEFEVLALEPQRPGTGPADKSS